jgi:putative hemolysin
VNQKNLIKAILRARYKKKIESFKAKINIEINKKNYIIKTASNQDELEQVLTLRHQVFLEELLHKKRLIEVDFDKFDILCDHLMIINKSDDSLIGTYRLNCSKFSNDFYSATEFNITAILELPGDKVELGRACVHPDYRNGMTIALLWKGLSEYMTVSESRFFFGCSSIKSLDYRHILNIYNALVNSGSLIHLPDVKPIGKFKSKSLKKLVKSQDPDYKEQEIDIMNQLPPLLKSYIKAGAKVIGQPALDKDFQCFDFLTLLDFQNADKKYKDKYTK